MPLMKHPHGGLELAVSEDAVMALEQVRVVATLAVNVDAEQVETAIRELERLHTEGIFDPSGYMRHMKNIQDRRKLLGAFLKFRKAIEALREP